MDGDLSRDGMETDGPLQLRVFFQYSPRGELRDAALFVETSQSVARKKRKKLLFWLMER